MLNVCRRGGLMMLALCLAAGCSGSTAPAPVAAPAPSISAQPAASAVASAPAASSSAAPVVSAPAPAEPPVAPKSAPPLSLDDLMNKEKAEAFRSELRDKPLGAFAPVLRMLGFSSAEIDAASKGTVFQAYHLAENLDEDPSLEEMVQVQVRDPRREEDAMTTPEVAHHFIAFLDRGPQGVTVAGRIARSVRICLTGTPPEVTLAPTHAAGYSDILVSWVDGPECNGNFRGVAGDQVLTIARGRLETLFEHQGAFENDRQTVTPIVPLVQMKAEGAPPKKLVLIDSKNKVRKRLTFDPARFAYK